MEKRIAALFALGIAGIVAFFWFMGLPEILSVIANADHVCIILSFLMQVAALLLLGMKLDAITKGQGNLRLVKGRWSAGSYTGIGFWNAFRANMSGVLASFLTPVARIGGEPVKIMALRKSGISVAASTAIVATDSFTEVFSYYVIVMASIAFILITGTLSFAMMIPFILIFMISSALLVLFFVMCFNFSILTKVVGMVKAFVARMPRRFSRADDGRDDYAWGFYDTFTLMMTNKPFMIRIFAVSFLVKLLEFLRMYFLFVAFGYDVSFVTIILAWSIMLLVGMIPATPGGLGFVEAGGTYAYVIFGIAKPVAGAVVVIDRLISFWFVIFIGFLVVFHEKIEKKIRILAKKAAEMFQSEASKLRKAGKKDFGRRFQNPNSLVMVYGSLISHSSRLPGTWHTMKPEFPYFR